jgi:hypothetical protein
MPATPNGLPYPASTATPNVPADIQALANALDPFAKSAVWGSYQRTTNQTVTTGGAAQNVIGTQITMEGGLVLNATTGEVTVPVGGLYLLNGWGTFLSLANTTGVRLFYWNRNSVTSVRVQGWYSNGTGLTTPCVKVTRLVAGDKVAFQVFQTSGVSMTLDGTNSATGYDVIRLAP